MNDPFEKIKYDYQHGYHDEDGEEGIDRMNSDFWKLIQLVKLAEEIIDKECFTSRLIYLKKRDEILSGQAMEIENKPLV